MCISAQALALFLSILDPAIVTEEEARVTIRATDRVAVWNRIGGLWCSDAPNGAAAGQAGP